MIRFTYTPQPPPPTKPPARPSWLLRKSRTQHHPQRKTRVDDDEEEERKEQLETMSKWGKFHYQQTLRWKFDLNSDTKVKIPPRMMLYCVWLSNSGDHTITGEPRQSRALLCRSRRRWTEGPRRLESGMPSGKWRNWRLTAFTWCVTGVSVKNGRTMSDGFGLIGMETSFVVTAGDSKSIMRENDVIITNGGRPIGLLCFCFLTQKEMKFNFIEKKLIV